MATIRLKMMAIGAALFVLAGGSAAAGLGVVRTLNQGLIASDLASRILRNQMQADMMHDALRADVLAALVAGDPTSGLDLSEVRADLVAHTEVFGSSIAENQTLASDPEMREALDAVRGPLGTYAQTAQRIVDLADRDAETAKRQLPDFSEQFSTLEAAMGKVGDVIEEQAGKTAMRALAVGETGSSGMLAALAVSLLAAAGIAISSQRSIVAPIRQLARDMHLLAAGRTDIALARPERRDEVGEIAQAVRAFQAMTVERVRKDGEDAALRATQETEALRRDESERQARSQEQETVVENLAEGLRRLASGDLGHRIDHSFSPQYERLRLDFNEAIGAMASALGAISSASIMIRDGVENVNGASSDLSARTGQQAASLEETAAAVEEITVAVRRTAERASRAQAVVATSAAETERSGDVTRQAVGAMAEIEASSEEIGKIIGVIDEIAFQTNLLALNAGVEAARAGEAGRGFAVVAQEVRGLAQRSADAAKQIKALISTSGVQVGRGVRLVGETQGALEAIAGQVLQLNQLISEIAKSATEQSVGLGEVNATVKQIDLMTQQNAAMVEESTATTTTLAGETKLLIEAVARFKVPAGRAPVESDRSRRRAA